MWVIIIGFNNGMPGRENCMWYILPLFLIPEFVSFLFLGSQIKCRKPEFLHHDLTDESHIPQ